MKQYPILTEELAKDLFNKYVQEIAWAEDVGMWAKKFDDLEEPGKDIYRKIANLVILEIVDEITEDKMPSKEPKNEGPGDKRVPNEVGPGN